MNEDVLDARFKNQVDMFRLDNRFTVDDNLVTFDRNNFTRIFINEIFRPCFQHTSRKLAPHDFLQIRFGYLNVLCKIEDFKYILVIFKAYSSQQRCNRQLLLAVNISIHDIVYVSCKLNPGSLKRNNTRRIQLGSIRMDTLSKEYARRTVQLRNDNSLSAIDDKGSFRSHIRNRSQIHVLNHRVKVFVIGVCTIKLQFGFQGNTISQSTFQTIINGIVRRIDIVVKELEHEVVACISNREIFRKNLIQAIVFSFFGRGI